MSAARGRAPVRAALVAVLLVALAPLAASSGLAPLGVPPTRAAASDLSIVTAATYTVQPAKGRVRVIVTAVIANHRADTKVNRFYFDHAFLAVQPGAAAPTVTDGPSGSSVRVASRSADATVLRLDFGKLYGGKSRTVKFAFNLQDPGSGARRLIRIGTSLITFPVWAYASDGATGSRVIVRFPKGYDVQVESGSFASRGTSSDGGMFLATGPLANPLSFFAYVSAQQPATYRDSSLSVPVAGARIDLTMRAWKDDKSWAPRVGALFEQALPVLRDAVGFPWPHATPVVVQEAVSRSTGGYAGLYDPEAGQIQVAYWASQAVIVHEAAHGWFNGHLLADRWAVEGFSSLYAQQALTTLKIKASAPKITAKLQAAAFPLNAWPAAPAPASASESYGYAASYALAAAIAERAGPAAMANVWAAAKAGVGAYQPPAVQGAAAARETVDGAPDWRGLLDLLEAQTGKEFTDLWRAWVVRPGEAALLVERAAARSAYAALVAEADGWVVPRSVRDALRNWRFETAQELIAGARAVLAQRTGLEAQAAASGCTLPGKVEALFESGAFAAAVAEAGAEAAAMTAITTVGAGQQAAADPFTAVGLIGIDPAASLATARAALAAGDPAGAVAAANDASRARAEAFGEGRRRVLMGAALLAALAVLGASLGSRLRRSKRAEVPLTP